MDFFDPFNQPRERKQPKPVKTPEFKQHEEERENLYRATGVEFDKDPDGRVFPKATETNLSLGIRPPKLTEDGRVDLDSRSEADDYVQNIPRTAEQIAAAKEKRSQLSEVLRGQRAALDNFDMEHGAKRFKRKVRNPDFGTVEGAPFEIEEEGFDFDGVEDEDTRAALMESRSYIADEYSRYEKSLNDIDVEIGNLHTAREQWLAKQRQATGVRSAQPSQEQAGTPAEAAPPEIGTSEWYQAIEDHGGVVGGGRGKLPSPFEPQDGTIVGPDDPIPQGDPNFNREVIGQGDGVTAQVTDTPIQPEPQAEALGYKIEPDGTMTRATAVEGEPEAVVEQTKPKFLMQDRLDRMQQAGATPYSIAQELSQNDKALKRYLERPNLREEHRAYNESQLQQNAAYLATFMDQLSDKERKDIDPSLLDRAADLAQSGMAGAASFGYSGVAGIARAADIGAQWLDDTFFGDSVEQGDGMFPEIARLAQELSEESNAAWGVGEVASQRIENQAAGAIGQIFPQVAISATGGVAASLLKKAPALAKMIPEAVVRHLPAVASITGPLFNEAISDAERTMMTPFDEMTPEQRSKTVKSAAVSTAVAGAIERLGLEVVAGKVIRGSDAIPTDEVVKRLTSGKIFKDFLAGFVGEGSTEATQEYVMDSVAKFFYDAERDLWDEEAVIDRFKAYVLGGIAGGVAKPAMSAVTDYSRLQYLNMQEDQQKEVSENLTELILDDQARQEVAQELGPVDFESLTEEQLAEAVAAKRKEMGTDKEVLDAVRGQVDETLNTPPSPESGFQPFKVTYEAVDTDTENPSNEPIKRETTVWAESMEDAVQVLNDQGITDNVTIESAPEPQGELEIIPTTVFADKDGNEVTIEGGPTEAVKKLPKDFKSVSMKSGKPVERPKQAQNEETTDETELDTNDSDNLPADNTADADGAATQPNVAVAESEVELTDSERKEVKRSLEASFTGRDMVVTAKQYDSAKGDGSLPMMVQGAGREIAKSKGLTYKDLVDFGELEAAPEGDGYRIRVATEQVQTPRAKAVDTIKSNLKLSEKGAAAVDEIADVIERVVGPDAFSRIAVEAVTADQMPEGFQDRSGVWDRGSFKLRINRDVASKKGDGAVESIFHESGHVIAEAMDDFILKEYQSLTPEQREAAKLEYEPTDTRTDEQLLGSKNARQEWFNFQLFRVAKEGPKTYREDSSLSDSFKERVIKAWEEISQMIRQWIGDASLSTEAMDAKIREILFGETPLVSNDTSTTSQRDASRSGTGDGVTPGVGQPAVPTSLEPTGKSFTSKTPEANARKVEGRWTLVDASEIKTSQDSGFDASLQPRNRNRRASQEQIEEIAKGLDPERISESQTVDIGAPMLNYEGMVLSGNGRTESIRLAYQKYPNSARKLRLWLNKEGGRFGIDSSKVNDMQMPMLVRVVEDFGGMSQKEFARVANKQQTMGMSIAEKASVDAQVILDSSALREIFRPNESAGVMASTNREFLNQFIEATGDRVDLISADGSGYSPELEPRLKRALIAAAIGPNETQLITTLTEETEGLRRVANAIAEVAPQLVELQGGEFDISAELADALRNYVPIVRDGGNVDQFLSQVSLFGDESRNALSDAFLKKFGEHGKRSAKKIVEYFSEYARQAQSVDTTTQGMDLGLDETSRESIVGNLDEQSEASQSEQADLPQGESSEVRAQDSEGEAGNESVRQVSKPKPAPKTEADKLLDDLVDLADDLAFAPAERNNVAKYLDTSALSKPPSIGRYVESEARTEILRSIARSNRLRYQSREGRQSSLEALQKATGTEVQYFQSQEGGIEAEGFAHAQAPNVIFINSASNMPLAWTLAHEVSHVAQKDPNSGFSELEMKISELLTVGEKNELLQDLLDSGDYGMESVSKELTPYIVGDVFGNQNTSGYRRFENRIEIENTVRDYFENIPALNPQALQSGEDADLALSPREIETFNRPFPKDKRTAFMGVIEKLADAGINTPESLVEGLQRRGGEKLRPYIQTIWNGLAMFDATAAQTPMPDWSSVYSELNKPRVNAVEQFEQDLKTLGSADYEGAAYKIIESDGQPGTYFVQRTVDGVRGRVSGDVGSIEAAQQAAVEIVEGRRQITNKPRADSELANAAENAESPSNATGGQQSLESDRADADARDGMGEDDVRDGQRATRSPRQPDTAESKEGGSQPGDNRSVSGSRAPTDGAQSDTDVRSAEQPDGSGQGTSRSADPARGRPADGAGQDASGSRGVGSQGITRPRDGDGQDGDAVVVDPATSERLAAQQAANKKQHKVRWGDPQSVKEVAPLLLHDQQVDVANAGTRFFGNAPASEFNPNGKGMLFTNGTGTGKTFVGLGTAKMFIADGKSDILFVVPTGKVEDWISDAQKIGIQASTVKDTSTAGQGVTIVGYENFRQNQHLWTRKFDLVISDEAHKLMSNKDGEVNATLEAFRTVAGHPSAHQSSGDYRNPEWFKLKLELDKKLKPLQKKLKEAQDSGDKEAETAARVKIDAARFAFNEQTSAMRAQSQVEGEAIYGQTKILALSATPFAYHNALEWANGYIVNWDHGRKPGDVVMIGNSRQSAKAEFFVRHLGYRIRYHNLTKPDADVDGSLMERELSKKLTDAGAMSGRKINLDKDYSREFVLVDSNLGTELDRGVGILKGYIDSEKNEYKALPALVGQKFSFVKSAQLLESIKAVEAVRRARKHLDMGRKAVVFHSYLGSTPRHPFRFTGEDFAAIPDPDLRAAAMDEASRFEESYPELVNLDFSEVANLLEMFESEFGDRVTFFNGRERKGRHEGMERFNDPDSGVDVIVAQVDAAQEGLSLHDTDGKKPRVLINVGIPVKPVTVAQEEGRIYRVGLQSNAIYENLVLHTNMERTMFGERASERSGTVENLAMGDQSRNLQEALREGYMNAAQFDPNGEQGTGGVAQDRRIDTTTDFDRAKSYYFGRQKRNSKTKAMEGADYFATPEPLGLKMVEWGAPRPGEHMMEPSVGHAAIGRFFPDTTSNLFIEPSHSLASEARVVTKGRFETMQFEDLDLHNKADVIVMNPPFGSGGKTAYDHVRKAVRHLNNGGRIIAIVPDGPAAQKQFEKFVNIDEHEHIYVTHAIKLPAVTFERAGTKVATQILVIDRVDNIDYARSIGYGHGAPKTVNLRDIENINELFDEIQGLKLAPRVVVPVKEKLKAKKDREKFAALMSGRDGQLPDSIASPAQFAHTRTGETVYVAKLNTRVPDWGEVKAIFRQHGGYYSKYNKGGAIPGIHFKDADSRDQFIADMEETFGSEQMAGTPIEVIDAVEEQFAFAPREKGDSSQERVIGETIGDLTDKRTVFGRFRDYLKGLAEDDFLRFRQGTLDGFAAIRQYEKRIFGANVKIDASISGWKAALMTKNLPSVMQQVLTRGTLEYVNGSVQLKKGSTSLASILATVGNSRLKLWEGYVAAYRAKRLLDEGKENNFKDDPEDMEGGMTAKEKVDSLLALGKKFPEFETARKAYAQWNRDLLDFAEAAGVIDPAAREVWEKNDYVPFYRMAEEADIKSVKGPNKKKGLSGQDAGIKKLKGGEGKVAVIENIFRNAEKLIDASFKNIAMQRITDLAAQSDGVLEAIPHKAVPFKAQVKEIKQRLESEGIDTSGMTEEDLTKMINFWRMRAPSGPDVVSVSVKGKQKYYKVNDPLLLDSILGLGPDQQSFVVDTMLAAPKRLLTTAVTLDPVFMAANWMRDSLNAYFVSDSPLRWGFDSVKGVLDTIAESDSYHAILAAGGSSGAYNRIKDRDIRRQFAQMTADERRKLAGKISPHRLINAVKRVGRASEMANRVAVYDAAIRNGASVQEAAYQAMDLTNFTMHGNFATIRFLTRTVPFLNARLQGLYKLGRASGLGSGETTLQKLTPSGRFAGHAAVMVLGTMMLQALNWDDERYWELQDWDRDLYYHLWFGDEHIRIPKPFEVGALFSTIPERLAEATLYRQSPDLLGKSMGSMVLNTFAFNPIPQAAMPLLEQGMNLNTFGWRPIVSKAEQFQAPESQYSAYTSETLRELAKAMPDNAPEWFRSPKRLENLWRGYTGTLGTYVMDMADIVTRRAADYPARPDYGIETIPMLGNFKRRFNPDDSTRANRYVGEFYDLYFKALDAQAAIDYGVSEGDAAAVDRILEKKSGLLDKLPTLRAVRGEMSSIKKAQNEISFDPFMDPQAKARIMRKLNEERNNLARKVMKLPNP